MKETSMNEILNSVDKANFEYVKTTVDTMYSGEKNKILGKIAELNNRIDGMKMNIAFAVKKPECNVNLKTSFEQIRCDFESLAELGRKLEALEKTYALLKIV